MPNGSAPGFIMIIMNTITTIVARSSLLLYNCCYDCHVGTEGLSMSEEDAQDFVMIIMTMITTNIALLLYYCCYHCPVGTEGHSMAEEDALPHHWQTCSAAQGSAGGV